MHDNSLASALSQSGWDTLLVPTYTPIRTDETDVAVDQVFFGGINVYLQQKVPLFRHLPKLFDRFLDSPRLIRRVTSRAIETDPKMLGTLVVSMLRGSSGYQRKEVRRLVHWLSHDARDYLILSNILIGGFIPDLKRELKVPVVVTLQGDDIFLESLKEPHKSQALELIQKLDEHIDAYLVHSRFYADAMATYLGLSRDKMHITPLGIDARDFLDWSSSEPRRRTATDHRLSGPADCRQGVAPTGRCLYSAQTTAGYGPCAFEDRWMAGCRPRRICQSAV